jgi:hypothetical protein
LLVAERNDEGVGVPALEDVLESSLAERSALVTTD